MSTFHDLDLAFSAIDETGGGEVWEYETIDGHTVYKYIYPENFGRTRREQLLEFQNSPYVRNPRGPLERKDA